MEYKIFGPNADPPDDLRGDLAMFVNLTDEQRDAIANWFLSTQSYYKWAESGVPSEIAKSTILPEQFRRAAYSFAYLLNNWERSRLRLSEIGRDLLLLGCSPDDVAIIEAFLARVSPVKEKVWAELRGRAQNAWGLPTIDDVNIVCDARAIFGKDSYDGIYDAGTDGDLHKKFLGFAHLVILEIISSDDYGQRQRTAIQMNEEMFRRLIGSMNRASEQLNILKSHTASIASKS